MKEELHYQVALTLVPDLGPIRARLLIAHFGSASALFCAKKKEISQVEGIGDNCARSVKIWNDFNLVEAEILFINKHQIQPLFITDQKYPQRLLNCYDPPTLLYYRGHADLNSPRIISIIGTRNHTEYGKQVTEQLINSLQTQQVQIISGLAFGIDAIAHRNALLFDIPTIGVLGHGLDSIYPIQHKLLAKEMIHRGGLLTEFRKNTGPDKHNFPKRNRIVAGMADATIVIETAIKGGSMITAELAHSYNRDVFAVPGKITDTKSSGCLQLIQQNKAILLTCGEQLIEVMGWEEKKKAIKKQRALFIELSEEEKIIVDLLTKKGSMPIDEIYLQSKLSSSKVASVLLSLELQNLISSLPGKMYNLI